ncbi:sensor histidine kinase [Allosphingosinicella vermicomposti]|uniref:sensor histidine kinase n=1 Tax=Allosphingosinicella vermicomposti TaxID=614671 RepID=UPI000D10C1D2|nr:HWE histidine kinase domain-containing protein [Allosphingosinicella vermicomposti]
MVISAQDRTSGAPRSMREAINQFDWASTSLGPKGEWPAALRFAVDLCLRSPLPISIYWGPDLCLLYNDAWMAAAGDRHPGALGRPAKEVWADLWDRFGPQFETVWRTGDAVSADAMLLPVVRDGWRSDYYWTYALTPLIGEDGVIAGILSQGADMTGAVLAQRRLAFQVRLADALRNGASADAVKATAARLLGEHLSASRVGYSEVDLEQQTLSTSTDWTRDPSIPSLVGVSRMLGAFGETSHEWLLDGQPLAVTDHRIDPRTADPEIQATFDGIGVRAMIVVPLIGQGVLRAILYVHDVKPREWAAADIEIARDTAERTWEAVQRAQSEQSLRESEDHYRHAVELNPQVTWTATPEGRINRVSSRWEDWTGTSGIGESWSAAVHPDDLARTAAAWEQSLRTSTPLDAESRIKRQDGTYRWVRSRAYPRFAADGSVCLWYGTTEDIHERHQAQDHQRLLINELNHRVKNTLATVQAIAFQTLKGDISLADARARFEARLLALSRAHNLLTEENWEGAPIWRVVADSIAHLSAESGRFVLNGEPMWLAPRAALALALACHELSTNAVKYGALSNDRGHVEVTWQKRAGQLCIEWKEKDGPPVAPPSERGFGSRLIERGLAGDLDGKARLDFEPDGLRCMIEAPLSAVLIREGQVDG